MLTQADTPKILVLGGYGNFGKRICATLAKDPHLQVIIAGRDLKKAETLAQEIKQKNHRANIQGFMLDWHAPDFVQKLGNTHADIVIHAAGPFQGQHYTVAEACIHNKIHYVDLSDGREFVVNIKQLDEKAKLNNVVVISGASSVPGLSSVVVNTFADKFAILREIDFGIAPANKIERGEATVTAILGYTGKPFQRLENGSWKTVYGWQNLHRHYYGDNLGLRWHGNCDIPDLVLLPKRYPTLKTVVFHAGLEVTVLHFILWLMSWLIRAKIVKNWTFFRKPIISLSHLFDRFGTEDGGMYVRLRGSNHRYQPLDITWNCIAEQKDGPYIPTIPSLILVDKLLKGEIAPGARPCMDMFSLKEFEHFASFWHIYYTLEEIES